MPSDKKISELRSGVTLQAGDKILVARGQQNVYVTGSETPVLANFVPPTTKLFPHGAWGNGSTGPLNVADHPRGLIMADNSADTGGFKFASRTIPEDMQTGFVFTVRISYNGLTKTNSGAGIGFSTVTTGPGGKCFYLTRNYGNGGRYTSPFGGFWNPQASQKFTSVRATNYVKGWDFNWFRGVVIGTNAQLFYSEDGVNFAMLGEIDFGTPVTSYGLVMDRDANGANAALCDYFDSTELQRDPTLRQTGTISLPTPRTGLDAPHQYWRMNITENWGGERIGITMMQMRGLIGDTNLSVGGTAISSASLNNPDQGFNPAPNSSYPGWLSQGNTGWLGYKFPYPVMIDEMAYRLAVNEADTSSPKTVDLEYSDDGETWELARTIRNLPKAGPSLTTLVVNSDKAAVSAANPRAQSGKVLKTGVKAAYSTRRLYDDYNGPLYAIEGAGGSYDVYAGEDGSADTTVITRIASGGDVSITKWYDQSGNAHHAIPMPDGIPNRYVGFRPLAAKSGITTVAGSFPGIYFNGSPLDIAGLNFLSSPSYVIAGVKFDNLSYGQIVSGATTKNDSAAIGITREGRVAGLRHQNARADSQVFIGTRQFGYVVSKLTMTGTALATSVALNGYTLADLPQITNYASGDGNAGTKSRIGGAAWMNRPNDNFNEDTLNGVGVREIFIYDTTVDLGELYTSIMGQPKPEKKLPVVYPDRPDTGPTTPVVIETEAYTAPRVVGGERRFEVVRGAYAPNENLTMEPNIHKFVIPEYNTITFEMAAGGGSSGESAWDGPLPNSDDPGQDGPQGLDTVLLGPDGTYTLFERGETPNSTGGICYNLNNLVTTNAWITAEGGKGGKGWYFNGGPSVRASNPGPASASGANGAASIRNVNAGRDQISIGGGAQGGPPAMFLGYIPTQLGGAGGNGGYAKKVWNRSDLGAPKPGEVWTIIVGPGGVYGNACGGVAPGSNGFGVVRWS